MNSTARRIMNDRLARRGGEQEDMRRDERRMDYRRDHRMDREDREMDYGHHGHHGYGHGGRGEYRGSGEYYGTMEYTGDYRRGADHMDERMNGEHYDRRREHEMDGGGYSRNRYGEFTDRARGRDYGDDYAAHGEHESDIKLEKEDMKRWAKMLKNEDGTTGAHFEKHKIEEAARSQKIEPEAYTMDDLFMAANMLYSDYCGALRQFISRGDIEKEAMVYTKMADAFLRDKDGPSGSEKLALYFYCIVDDE